MPNTSLSLSSNSRHLQNGESWEVVYTIVYTSICGLDGTGCVDPKVIATKLKEAKDNGNLRNTLANNNDVSAALVTEVLDCLVVWGSVLSASSSPAVTTGSSDSNESSTNNTASNLFYPVSLISH